jgi:hypothetical protein
MCFLVDNLDVGTYTFMELGGAVRAGERGAGSLVKFILRDSCAGSNS